MVISTHYAGGNVEGMETMPQDFSATAHLDVKQAPVKVKLNALESYSVTSDKVPGSLGYTLTSGNASTEVEYTIQKSGDAVSARTTASGSTIPFSAGMPSGLKESYTVTVYARNSVKDDWSVDSMQLTVYNKDILDLVVQNVTAGEIGGTTGGSGESMKGKTVGMDNHDKLANYGATGENCKLSFSDFTALRTDMSLQKIISANYGSGVWGLLSDKMEWESSDPATISVDYKQGGIYSDIRNYSYTAYAPSTDFLLVGKGDTEEPVTITATHAATGMSASVQATATSLKDQLYVFQFHPAATTTVVYKNRDGESRELKSNDKGELAVYEPAGIDSPVMAMSQSGGKTYVGTIYPSTLVSGERDIAALQLYPCNNLRLRTVSNASLTFLKPDGTHYNGNITLRAGVYKNGVYCPGALVKTDENQAKGVNGREDISAQVTDGKLNLWFDPMQFNNPGETGDLDPGDTVSYVIEYRFEKNYRPGIVRLNASSTLESETKPTDSRVQLRAVAGSSKLPQVTIQTLQQYHGAEPTSYTRDVIDYTENIGISTHFDKAVLSTEVALPGETVTTDSNGYTTYTGEDLTTFSIYTTAGRELTGQDGSNETEAAQIAMLSDLTNDTKLYVFPFSSMPMVRSVYTMTNENMEADGITDVRGGDATSRIKMLFKQGGLVVKEQTLPFGVSNLSHQEDLGKAGGASAKMGQEIKKDVRGKVDIGTIFKQINVNDMVKKGFVFLQGIAGTAGDNMLNMMILPTEDPSTFRIMVFIGYNKRQDENTAQAGNLAVNYDPESLYDDAMKFDKALEDMQKDDDDDDDSSGEGSIKFNFYGTLLLDARLGVSDGDWDITFAGGNVGTNFKAGYEWSQTFMCGPYPFLLSFEVGAGTDIEVAFCSRKDAAAMLLDAAANISLDAFAGLGFDLSLVEFKLGVFGKINAGVNFLYLMPENQNGTKLSIDGEIGLKMEVKALLITYSKTFCSTGFGWTKTSHLRKPH